MDNAGSALRDAMGKGPRWLAIPAAPLTIVLILVLLEIGRQMLFPILLSQDASRLEPVPTEPDAPAP